MKFYNKIFAGAIALMAFSSCMNEDLESKFTAGGDEGTLELNVEVLQPARRDVSTTDFPVVIKDASGTVVKEYATVGEVPSSIQMSVGNYTVESHTPGNIAKSMPSPYYKGAADVEIVKDVNSPVEVVCKMENSQVTVNYDNEFRNVFSEWEITIEDGSNTVMSFKTTANQSSTVYWYFGDGGVKQIVVNFRGTTASGNTIAARNVLTKNQSSQGGYDDDEENFTGGDLITMNFAPTESTEGKITGINISASVVFDETTENITVDVIDVPGLDDPNQGGGSGGGSGEEGSITLNLPNDITMSPGNIPDASKGDTYIAASAGIKSIKVTIISDSQEMNESLADLNTNFAVDFLAGAEVVDNQNLVALFRSLGKTISVPARGDREYTFPVGNFFTLLQVLVGNHRFNMTVTDMDDNTKSGTILIKVVE